MSFKVGDRVTIVGLTLLLLRGTVTEILTGSYPYRVKWDRDEQEGVGGWAGIYQRHELRFIETGLDIFLERAP